jgi:hypothetical protein
MLSMVESDRLTKRANKIPKNEAFFPKPNNSNDDDGGILLSFEYVLITRCYWGYHINEDETSGVCHACITMRR